MKLTIKMNWLEIGKYIIQEMKAGVGRDTIESQMKKAFDWDDQAAYIATDPYYEVKRHIPSEIKVRRK